MGDVKQIMKSAATHSKTSALQELNVNKILGREAIYNNIKDFLQAFQQNKKDLTFKRGIYIYGAPGSGKTEFLNRLLKDLIYDIIKYDAVDIRNKSIID